MKVKFDFGYILLIVGIVIAFVFLVFSNSYSHNQYFERSIYDNVHYDYIIQKPGNNQISTLKQEEHFDFVVPFYQFNRSIKLNLNNIQTKIIILDDILESQHTNFSDERLLKNSGKTGNVIYVDHLFAINNDAKIGDIIILTIGEVTSELEIARIYETDNSFVTNNGVVLFETDVLFDDDIQKNLYTYAGAYLGSNNKSESIDYLRNYKPLGSLRSRELFDSDESYESYVEFFMSVDYSREIISQDEQRNTSMLSGNQDWRIIAYLLFSFLTLLIFILLPFFMKYKNEITLIKHDIEQNKIKDSLKQKTKFILIRFTISHIVLITLFLSYFYLIHKDIYQGSKMSYLIGFYITFLIIEASSHFDYFIAQVLYIKTKK